jgi:hypothetical protein
MTTDEVTLTILFALMALLYSSVGHAGSSGYQAAMALMGEGQELMKPTALSLNILVACIASVQFLRAGCFDRRVFFILVVASIPMAWIGGQSQLPTGWYNWLIAVVLWLAAIRLWSASLPKLATKTPPSWPFVLVVGAALGFLSGLTGTGGGIFLTPFLILTGWATPRNAAGISAAFILVNSISGFLGWLGNPHRAELHGLLPMWLAVVGACGLAGSWFGSRFGSPMLLRRLLAVVLVVAGLKMALTA